MTDQLLLQVIRDLRKISIVGLLLLSLIHAWSGHDLIHGHGHSSLGEVSYSTTHSRADLQNLFVVSCVAILTGIFELDLKPTMLVIEIVAHDDDALPDPVPISAGYIPRPPPSFSSIA